MAAILFFSCTLESSTEIKDTLTVQNKESQSKAWGVPDGTVCEYNFYEGLDCTGYAINVLMIRESDNSFRLVIDHKISLSDLSIGPESWDNRINSIELISHGEYPIAYVFADPDCWGGNGRVIKIEAQTTNIPAGFGISAILPVIPDRYATKKEVAIQVMDASGQYQYLCAESETDRPIKANRTAVGLWEKFELSYIDIDKRFFTLKARANDSYVCSDLNYSVNNGPLYANRNSVDYWEIFRIGSTFYETNTLQIVILSALSNARYLQNYGANYPIGSYVNASSYFYINTL